MQNHRLVEKSRCLLHYGTPSGIGMEFELLLLYAHSRGLPMGH